ncbi:MAG: AAA family ATPase [Marinifilaceae bacterium]
MELKFIWVKEYNNIKNQGFNFNHSGEHSFSFDGKDLEIISKPLPVLDFGPNIHSITAIAGENGSGKSSLCEIILEAVATKDNGAFSFNIPFEGIVCMDNYFFCYRELKVNRSLVENLNYIFIEYDESPLKPENNWFNEFDKTGFIYYSNVIDWRGDQRNLGLTNLSTQYLLPDTLWRKGKEKYEGMFPFYREDAYRIANFYLNYDSDCPFRGPEKIKVSPNYSGNNFFLYIDPNKEENKGKEYISKYVDNIQQFIYPSSWFEKEEFTKNISLDEQILKDRIKALFRLNLLVVLNREKLPDDSDSIRRYIFEGEAIEGIFNQGAQIDKLLGLINELVRKGEVVTEFRLGDYSDSEKYDEWRHHLLSFLVPNNSHNRSLLKEFIAIEEQILRDDRQTLMRINDYFFDSGQSSGEYSFLVLFARLFELLNRRKDYNDLIEEYIVLLDEPEIGFHPAWKKRFLKWLLDFLNSDFHNYKFQLIITSHSPYLLSDLPSENILLLRKKENGDAEIVDSNTRKTFGANIHELLSDSFFLTDGLIGEFAKDKINSLFKYLAPNGSNEVGWTPETALNLINQIGESIIRNHLIQLYDSKFSENKEVDLINEEIRRLEARKNQIQGGQQ